MIRKYSQLFLLVLCAIAIEGCAIHDYESDNQSSNRKDQYAIVWIQTYGLIDPNQDWCGVSAITADVTMAAGANKVNIYNASPSDGGHLIGRASHDCKLKLDMPKRSERIYVRFTDKAGHVISHGYYPIVDNYVTIAGKGESLQQSRAEGDAVQYAHTPSYFDAMIICEDLGSIGDFDFNDVVLGRRRYSVWWYSLFAYHKCAK